MARRSFGLPVVLYLFLSTTYQPRSMFCLAKASPASGAMLLKFASSSSVGRGRGVIIAATATSELSCHHLSQLRNHSTAATPSARAALGEKTFTVAKIQDNGSLTIESLKLPEILRKSTLHARDLFSLALTSSHELQEDENRRKMRRRPQYHGSSAAGRTPAAILPRGDEIVLSFGSIRALIGKDSGMIFDAHVPGTKLLASDIAATFELRVAEEKEIKWRRLAGLGNDASPEAKAQNGLGSADYDDWSTKIRHDQSESFEIVFIEEILRDTCETFNRRLLLYEPIVSTLLARVHNEMFSDEGVQHIVPIKDSLQEFELNVNNCLECLTHLLDNDEDMLALLLTEQHLAAAKGEDLHPQLHERVELLFEEYARQLNIIIGEIHFLLKKIQSKQELVAISLDSYRNRMIRMNVSLAIVGVGLGVGTTVAGAFGMNLISGYEASPTAFNTVVWSTSITSLAVVFGCTSYLSGSRMRERAMKRIKEIDTLSGALSDMSSLDYAIKTMFAEDEPMDKEEFMRKLSGANMNEDEVTLLFHILDLSRDGYIYTSDFRSMESLTGHQSREQLCETSKSKGDERQDESPVKRGSG